MPSASSRFSSVWHARSNFEGTGMGLAICRRIAERHRGTVVAQSAGENQGAVFTVTLPLAQTDGE